MDDQYSSEYIAVRQESADLVKAYLNKVYSWLAVSMAVTAGVAIYAAHDFRMIAWALQHQMLICLATLAVILVMSFAARRLTSGALGILLLAYAGLQGLLFGPLLLIYTTQSLGLTFGCTAGMFAAMSLYGYVTKKDLSSWGSILFMALIGLIIASLVNMFLGNNMMDLVISGVGVIVFCLFTAYDTQKILREGQWEDPVLRSKGAVFGALSLYMDFIILFLYLLRFLGSIKED